LLLYIRIKKGEAMKARLVWALVCVGVMGVGCLGTTTVLAVTAPVGVTATPLVPPAQFDEITSNSKSGEWKAKIETKGVTDVHVNQVTIQPGGNNGWHMHSGPSFVIVKSGTATFYEAGDRSCTPIVVKAGSSHFEPASDVHILRNEGDVPLVNIVIQMVATGAPRSALQPKPGNCSF
jgi:quercetin dioxygenase-like cupin family protein